MSKNREKKHAAHLAERKAHAQQAVENTAEQHEQHLVEAPKGTSRARFLFNLFLVVFLLLIFSITGPMMASLTGGGGATGEVFLSWTTPEGEKRVIETGDFYEEKRSFRNVEFLLPFLLGRQVDPGEDTSKPASPRSTCGSRLLFADGERLVRAGSPCLAQDVVDRRAPVRMDVDRIPGGGGVAVRDDFGTAMRRKRGHEAFGVAAVAIGADGDVFAAHRV